MLLSVAAAADAVRAPTSIWDVVYSVFRNFFCRWISWVWSCSSRSTILFVAVVRHLNDLALVDRLRFGVAFQVIQVHIIVAISGKQLSVPR
jgi:hypothetical protein